MLTETTTTKVFRVYIKATPDAIWNAITDPDWNDRYGYRAKGEYDLRPGGAYRGLANDAMKAMGSDELVVDGEVLEADPPHRLVQTWRFLWTPELVAEGFTKLTWDITDEGGVCRVTVTHELEGAPLHAEQVAGLRPVNEGGGGWSFVLSDLKTLLETGEALDF
jgi:uncharacterized protein YndB with AHSA1/START domain